MALDTHAFVKSLTAAGLSEAQAEAITTVVTAAREVGVGQLASKGDLVVIGSEVGLLRTEVGTLKADVGILKAGVGILKTDVGTLKADVGVLKADVGTLKSDINALKVEVSNTRTDLLKWMIGLVMTAVLLNAVTVTGGMVALIKVVGP